MVKWCEDGGSNIGDFVDSLSLDSCEVVFSYISHLFYSVSLKSFAFLFPYYIFLKFNSALHCLILRGKRQIIKIVALFLKFYFN